MVCFVTLSLLAIIKFLKLRKTFKSIFQIRKRISGLKSFVCICIHTVLVSDVGDRDWDTLGRAVGEGSLGDLSLSVLHASVLQVALFLGSDAIAGLVAIKRVQIGIVCNEDNIFLCRMSITFDSHAKTTRIELTNKNHLWN